MSKINYMNFLDQAIEQARSSEHIDALGGRILEQWRMLEQSAEARGYDVLGDNSGTVRHRTALLLRSLYEVPGALDDNDKEQLEQKDKEYGGSWCRRGGTGAFHMAARKADRIAHQLERFNNSLSSALAADRREEGILDDLGDLRRYLLLWVAWMMAAGKAT